MSSQPAKSRGWMLRLVLPLLALLVILGAGGYAIWRNVRDQVLQGRQYRLSQNEIHTTPQPAWIRSDVREEVFRDASLDGPLSVLDPELAERVYKAFTVHPWVARVERVSKYSPARVEVEIEYRRPVLMVEVPGGLYPVDVSGVLLPSGDFSPQEARQYPRLSGIEPTTEGPVGTAWNDARVLGAARLAALLADVWHDWKLHRIVPEPAGSDRPIEYDLVTQRGTRFHWGAAPAADEDGRALALRKFTWLKEHFTEQGTLESPEGSPEIDLRQAVQ